MNKTRSIIQYYGGKGNLLSKLLPLVPSGGRPYLEPFCGGASLFFARDPAPVEVLNDIDNDVVTLFRVLQDKVLFEELRHRLMWTPYSRAEFIRALEMRRNPNVRSVSRAWAVFVTQNQGMSGIPNSAGNWSCTFVSRRGMAKTTSAWQTKLSQLDIFRERLLRVQIDNRDAIEAIQYWDNPQAVIYCDPPYIHETRSEIRRYRFEYTTEQHQALVQTLLECKGAVVLSGYNHPVYAPLEIHGWRLTKIITSCHAAGRVRGSGLQGEGSAKAKVPRVECVWQNPLAIQLTQLPL